MKCRKNAPYFSVQNNVTKNFGDLNASQFFVKNHVNVSITEPDSSGSEIFGKRKIIIKKFTKTKNLSRLASFQVEVSLLYFKFVFITILQLQVLKSLKQFDVQV